MYSGPGAAAALRAARRASVSVHAGRRARLFFGQNGRGLAGLLKGFLREAGARTLKNKKNKRPGAAAGLSTLRHLTRYNAPALCGKPLQRGGSMKHNSQPEPETDTPSATRTAEEPSPARRPFVEPEISAPVDVLEATTFFNTTTSIGTPA
jgi:hypothetical protein